jgi:lysophospholipase L1-like esterase
MELSGRRVVLRGQVFAWVRVLLLCITSSAFGAPPGHAQSVPPSDVFDTFLANCPQSQVYASVASSPWPTTVVPTPHSGATRIGIWGDSHTASGHFVDAMLSAWGFGNARALPATMAPAFGIPGVRLPLRDHCQSAGWKQQTAHRANPHQGGFSTSLMHLSASAPGEALWLDFGDWAAPHRLQALTLHFAKADSRRALVLGLSINHAPETLVSLTDAARSMLQIRPPTGPLTSLRLRLVTGQITLHALDLAYQNPPEVLVDVFSTPGALASGWTQPGIQALPGARYDLVIFQHGTNDAIGTVFDPEAYTQGLRQSLTRFRAVLGHTRCILIGPPDRVSQPAVLPPYGLRHLVINRIQDSLSREFKCQFWNWQTAMGHDIQRWASANPPLAQPDLTHLTGTGYAQSARLFATAMPWPAFKKP